MTASAARANFAELIGRVAYGKERLTIERRGKALIALVPLDDLHRLATLEGASDGGAAASAEGATNGGAGAGDQAGLDPYSIAQSAADIHAANRALEREIAVRADTEARLRQSELRAREAEAQLREAIESITDAFVLYDADGRLVICNAAFKTLYGYSDQEAVPGVHARDLGRLDVERGIVAMKETPEAYFSWRDTFWDPPRSRYQIRLADDRCIDVADRRTASGGLLSIQRDITEAERAEATLRESEQRFRDFADTASDWFWEMDETLRFTYFSERYQESGFHLDDRIGKTRFETAAEDLDQAKWHRHRADLQARRPFRDLQYWLATPQGARRFMSVSGTPTFDESGRFTGYRGTASDITERKRAEDALRLSEARFQAFLEHSPAAIGIKDPQGVYVLANKGFETIHGTTGQQPIGKTAYDFMPKRVADAITAHDRSVIRSGVAVQQEIVLPGDDGERTFLTVKFPIPDLGGGSAGIGAISTEITQSKKIGEELKRSEERLRQATQLAGLGYWVWDALTDACLYCSEQHARIHGLSVEEYIARSATLGEEFLLTHPDDRERVHRAYADLRRGHAFEMAYRVVTPRGDVRYVQEIAKPLFDASGKVIQEVGTSRDVTDQKQAEEQLLQAQKMEALGYLTGGITHDFNNLLAVITGNAELLSDDLGTSDHRVQAVLHAAGRGAELTRRLLAFSRRQPLTPKPLAIDALVSHMSELLERTIGRTITIEVANAPDLWLAMADAGQVENALLNLAINARDATPNGGTVTVETANAHIGPDQAAECPNLNPGDYVMLCVRDTGCGIPPEVLEHIFEPFFTTKPVGKGSGLGLSMIYGFAEQSGGGVTVESTPGHGTTFRLYLPRAVDQASDARG